MTRVDQATGLTVIVIPLAAIADCAHQQSCCSAHRQAVNALLLGHTAARAAVHPSLFLQITCLSQPLTWRSGKRKLAREYLQRRGSMFRAAAISSRRGTAFSSLVVPQVLRTHLVGYTNRLLSDST